MKLDFRDGSEDFTEIEKEFANYMLSGVELTEVELEIKFGPILGALKDNLVIRRYVVDKKIERKSKRQLIDDMHVEKFIKVIPLALKTLIDIMQTGSETNRAKVAIALGKPSMAHLEKLATNSADIEFIFDDKGNAIKIDDQDKAL